MQDSVRRLVRSDARLAMTACYDPVRDYPEWEMGGNAPGGWGLKAGAGRCAQVSGGVAARTIERFRAASGDRNRKVFLERPTG